MDEEYFHCPTCKRVEHILLDEHGANVPRCTRCGTTLIEVTLKQTELDLEFPDTGVKRPTLRVIRGGK